MFQYYFATAKLGRSLNFLSENLCFLRSNMMFMYGIICLNTWMQERQLVGICLTSDHKISEKKDVNHFFLLGPSQGKILNGVLKLGTNQV